MHSGGSMTGGSVQSRMTSLLSRSREIEESETALKKIEAEFAAAREKYAAIEESRGELKRERGELYDELHKQLLRLAVVTKQIERLACVVSALRLLSGREPSFGAEAVVGRAVPERRRNSSQHALRLCDVHRDVGRHAGEEPVTRIVGLDDHRICDDA